MLIPLNHIVSKYGKPRGIIHIGAHLMEEREDYLSLGLDNTIWIEANENKYKKICELVKNTKEKAFSCVVSDEDDKQVNFHVTNNGQSSSILELEKHLVHHPQVHVVDTFKMKTTQMYTLIKSNNINLESYNFINLDIQGAELLALKGFCDLLHKFNFIYTEVNTNHIYKDCALIKEIDDYLLSFGFERKMTKMTQYEWGDALYLKK